MGNPTTADNQPQRREPAPRAAIITVGSEIISGKITDTNCGVISYWLGQLGVKIDYHLSVSDSPDSISWGLEAVIPKVEIVVLTGGLGPTQDDLTLATVARFVGAELELSSDMVAHLKEFFANRGDNIPKSNQKQALLPTGGEFLVNQIGTAPGVALFYQETQLILLPGPPWEMAPMLDSEVAKLLHSRFSLNPMPEEIVRVYEAGESDLQDILDRERIRRDIGIYFKKEGWIELHFPQPTTGEVEEVVQLLEREGLMATGNIPLSELVLEELTSRGLTLAFAESMTAGALSSELAKTPGASAALKGGIVAYSDDAKVKLLGVSPETLSRFGAVSEETVREMAEGAKTCLDVDVVVSISGVADKSRSTSEGLPPAGTIWVSLASSNRTETWHKRMRGERSRVLRRSVIYCYCRLYRWLRERGQSTGTTVPRGRIS